MSPEEINTIKKEMEDLVIQFNERVQKLGDAGFKVRAQANNTVYIFKQKTEIESYGELYDPPTANPNGAPHAVNG